MARNIIFGTILFIASSMAYGAAVLQGTTASATGILGLEIGSDVYDVAFSQMSISYDEQFPAKPPAFFNDSAGAEAAAGAIAAFLTTSAVTGIQNLISSGFTHHVLVPFEETATLVNFWAAGQTVEGGSSWSKMGGLSGDFDEGFINGSWATFSIVPIPGALPLFAVALAGLAWARRQKAA